MGLLTGYHTLSKKITSSVDSVKVALDYRMLSINITTIKDIPLGFHRFSIGLRYDVANRPLN